MVSKQFFTSFFDGVLATRADHTQPGPACSCNRIDSTRVRLWKCSHLQKHPAHDFQRFRICFQHWWAVFVLHCRFNDLQNTMWWKRKFAKCHKLCRWSAKVLGWNAPVACCVNAQLRQPCPFTGTVWFIFIRIACALHT